MHDRMREGKREDRQHILLREIIICLNLK